MAKVVLPRIRSLIFLEVDERTICILNDYPCPLSDPAGKSISEAFDRTSDSQVTILEEQSKAGGASVEIQDDGEELRKDIEGLVITSEVRAGLLEIAQKSVMLLSFYRDPPSEPKKRHAQ